MSLKNVAKKLRAKYSLGSIWSFGADTTVLGFIGHVIAGTVWSIFHILIVLLQAFIFMMLTLVYIGQAHDTH